LIDLFRIEEVLSHVTNALDYVRESIQLVYDEKNRDLQERQERLFLYLSIILGASVVTEAINVLLTPYGTTTPVLWIQYFMALAIIAIFGFIMVGIFKK
jgi:hypothetical protein